MKSLKYIILFFLLIIFRLDAEVAAPWGDYPKRITGEPAPLSKIPPYTVMSNIGGGVWVYSNYFTVGSDLYVKFAVQTNTNSSFILELLKPFNISLPWGQNNTTYYITNKDTSGTPINIVRVTEGTTNNMFVQLEFNWEGDPDPPTGIIGKAYAEQAIIEWTPSVELDVIGYNLYMSNKFLSSYTQLNTNLITTNSFSVTGLSNGTTNYFYVTSIDAYTNMPNNESPPSSVVQVVPGKDVYVLFYCTMNIEFVPDGLYIAGEPSPLNWSGIKMQYLYNNIWYYKDKFTEFSSIKYKYKYTSTSNIWERDFDTSSKNREITLIDEDGDSIIVINDIWNMDATMNPAPAPPTNIIAIPGNSNVALLWSPNKEPDIKGYRVYRSNSTTTNFELIGTINTTNFIDTQVINNTNYYYCLTAIDNGDNESDFSIIVTATPSTNPAPIVPRDFKAIPGNNLVILRWSPNPEQDIIGYVIYRSNTGTIFSNFGFLVTNTTYTDNTVINGTTYYYKLRAVDTIGQTNWGFSEMVSATPSSDPAPLQPSGLELLLAGDRMLIVGWAANDESDIAGYKIYYGTNSFAYSNFTTTTTSTLTGLINGKRYQIALKAMDTNNQLSEISETLYAYPVPEIIDLSAKPAGSETGAVLLSFTAPDVAGSLGSAYRYIVKYSTNKIYTLAQFQQAQTFSETFANYSGTIESIKVNNLGTGCPGYYFTVGAVYGQDITLGLSDSVYSVAAELVPTSQDKTIYKVGEKLKVVIPAGVLPDEASAIVIKNRTDLIKEEATSKLKIINDAFLKAQTQPYIKLLSPDLFYDIYPINSAGNIVVTKDRMNGYAKVYLPFEDSDHNGIVDGTDIRIDTLRLFRLNEDSVEWGFVQKSIMNNVDNLVYGFVDHFSVFTIMANLPADGLKNVKVYPNPIISPSENNKIKFKNLPAGAKIRIYNLAGELVKQGLIADLQGRCEWNCLNDSSKPVASGIYIYYIENGKYEPVKGKIGIVR